MANSPWLAAMLGFCMALGAVSFYFPVVQSIVMSLWGRLVLFVAVFFMIWRAAKEAKLVPEERPLC